MQKIVICFLMFLFLSGCGDRKSDSKYQGKTKRFDYTAKAVDYLSKKDIPNAIKNFDEAIKADPQNPEKYITLGQVYLGLKNYDRAIDTFSAAIRVGPNSPEAFYFLAMSRSLRDRDGEKIAAVEAIKRSAELYYAQKDQEGMIKAMALYKSLTEEDEIPQEKAAQ